MLVLGSQQADVETWKPQTRGLSISSIADLLSLNFLGYVAKITSYFSMKTNKRKVRKCLLCVNEFWNRFDLANGKYLSIFLRVLQELLRLHILLRLSLSTNFTWKIENKRYCMDFPYKTKSCVTWHWTQFVSREFPLNTSQNKYTYKHSINRRALQAKIG